MRISKDFSAFTRSGGIGKQIVTLLLNPNFHCVCLYRLSNLFYKAHLEPLSKIIWYINRLLFHVDIDYRADLAGGFMLVHGLGTVIGRDVKSLGRLTVYQHVTLGGSGNGRPGWIDGDGHEHRMPLLEDNVKIYTGAIVVGGIKISKNTTIKAGQIISHDM